MRLKNEIKVLSANAIENMDKAVKAQDTNTELFHKGEFDVYNMVNVMLELGKSKREIAKLVSSLELESKARHATAERKVELRHEEGRLSATAAIRRMLMEGI